jgi:hypothetical protein
MFETFDALTYYSSSFDVFTYSDDEEGQTFKVVAKFETLGDAREYVNGRKDDGSETYIRPPSDHVRIALDYLRAIATY